MSNGTDVTAHSSTTAHALQKLLGPEPSPSKGPATKKELWLDAWNDPVANINCFSGCIAACDLYADGDSRLVIADTTKKLKLWKGTHKSTEMALTDVPCALAIFVPELTTPRMPALAIAISQFVYIFRNLKPFAKFVVPSETVNPDEVAVWNGLASGTLTTEAAEAKLQQVLDSGAALTAR